MTREEAIKVIKDGIEDMSLDFADEEQYEALTMAIKALEQKPSGDLISRQAVLDGIEELKKSPWATDKRGNGFEYLIAEALDVVADLCVKQAPSVEQEPKTGHWSHDGSHWKNRFICSECGYKLFDEPTNYCPNCGCRMVEPQEGSEE